MKKKLNLQKKTKAWRKKKKITQQELGKLLGVSQASIYQYENSKMNFSVAVLERLIKVIER